MSTVDLRELYLQYGCCMAAVIREKDGDEGIGAAFHIGDGVFVTARHGVEGRIIKERSPAGGTASMKTNCAMAQFLAVALESTGISASQALCHCVCHCAANSQVPSLGLDEGESAIKLEAHRHGSGAMPAA